MIELTQEKRIRAHSDSGATSDRPKPNGFPMLLGYEIEFFEERPPHVILSGYSIDLLTAVSLPIENQADNRRMLAIKPVNANITWFIGTRPPSRVREGDYFGREVSAKIMEKAVKKKCNIKDQPTVERIELPSP